MKPLLLVILLFSATIATAQKATIRKHDGTVADVTIQALSETAIFTNAGNIDLKDLDIISFNEQNDEFQRTYTKLKEAGVIVVFGLAEVADDAFSWKSKNTNFVADLPFNEEGKLVLTEVVESQGSANELYLRAKLFVANTFKSANAVIQLDDPANNVLVGKGFSEIYIQNFAMTEIRFRYTLKIETREGRYKYQLYDFTYEDSDTPEEYFFKETYFRNNGKPKVLLEKYKEATLKELKSFRYSLLSQMQKPAKKDDW